MSMPDAPSPLERGSWRGFSTLSIHRLSNLTGTFLLRLTTCVIPIINVTLYLLGGCFFLTIAPASARERFDRCEPLYVPILERYVDADLVFYGYLMSDEITRIETHQSGEWVMDSLSRLQFLNIKEYKNAPVGNVDVWVRGRKSVEEVLRAGTHMVVFGYLEPNGAVTTEACALQAPLTAEELDEALYGFDYLK